MSESDSGQTIMNYSLVEMTSLLRKLEQSPAKDLEARRVIKAWVFATYANAIAGTMAAIAITAAASMFAYSFYIEHQSWEREQAGFEKILPTTGEQQ